jgi:hypothetical protein
MADDNVTVPRALLIEVLKQALEDSKGQEHDRAGSKEDRAFSHAEQDKIRHLLGLVNGANLFDRP